MANLPEILVHREMNEEPKKPPVPLPRERRKPGKARKNLFANSHSQLSLQNYDGKPNLEGSKVRIKNNGKPSRRWLGREIERLKLVNDELLRGIQQKEANELNLIEAKARLETELMHYRSDTSTTNKERLKMLSQDVFLLKNLVVK